MVANLESQNSRGEKVAGAAAATTLALKTLLSLEC